MIDIISDPKAVQTQENLVRGNNKDDTYNPTLNIEPVLKENIEQLKLALQEGNHQYLISTQLQDQARNTFLDLDISKESTILTRTMVMIEASKSIYEDSYYNSCTDYLYSWYDYFLSKFYA
jgi:hypothetical protein